MIDQFENYPDFDENKRILTERMNELEEIHTMRQKLIWIKKNKSKFISIKVHIVNKTQPCEIPEPPKPELDHFDCKTIEELIEVLKEFGITKPILKTQDGNKIVSIESILTVDTHCFCVSES